MATIKRVLILLIFVMSNSENLWAQQSLRVSPNGRPPITPVVEVVTGGSRWWHHMFLLWPSPELRILKNEEDFKKNVTLIDYLGSEIGDLTESEDFSAVNFASIKLYLDIEIPQNISPEDVIVLNPAMYSRQKAMLKAKPGKDLKPVKLELAYLMSEAVNPSTITKPVRIVLKLPIVNGIYEISAGEFELPIEISGSNITLQLVARIDQKSRKIILRTVADGCEKLLI